MLPAMHQAWAETTGALWSSRTMIVRPFSRIVRLTSGGIEGIEPLLVGRIDSFAVMLWPEFTSRLRRIRTKSEGSNPPRKQSANAHPFNGETVFDCSRASQPWARARHAG